VYGSTSVVEAATGGPWVVYQSGLVFVGSYATDDYKVYNADTLKLVHQDKLPACPGQVAHIISNGRQIIRVYAKKLDTSTQNAAAVEATVPSETTEPPVKTTAPSETTEPPVKTTAPSETTEPPVKTTAPSETAPAAQQKQSLFVDVLSGPRLKLQARVQLAEPNVNQLPVIQGHWLADNMTLIHVRQSSVLQQQLEQYYVGGKHPSISNPQYAQSV